MFRQTILVLALSFWCGTSIAVKATDVSRTTLYPVLGKTAPEVYRYIKTHAPRVAQNATFAFTMIATRTDKKTLLTSSGCHYSRFRTSAFYNFVIPRHSNPAAMASSTRSQFASFAAYLKIHEQGHRAIWQACLANYDTQALTLDAATCASLDKAREALFTRLKRTCRQQDETYDAQFRKDVMKVPFVAQALRRQ